jgi:tripartite-type tricarboxylate transporter receptor subunit TctC
MVLLICAAITSAAGQEYPRESIRLVVPFPPGGNTDVTARLIAAKMSDSLGKSLVVENIGGAGGTIGSGNVARAEPNGYVLLYGSTSTLAIAPSVYGKLSYDPLTSFVAVGLVATAPHILFVNPNLPVRSTEDLIAYAKANPGKLNYASPGLGTPNHLAAELFKSKAGIQAVHVPYRGGSPALTAVVAGDVHFAFDTMAVIRAPMDVGQVRALGIASSQRSPLLPELRTLAETGLPGMEAASWNGIVAPAGTSSAVVSRLNAEIGKGLQDADLRAKFATLGIEPAHSSPEAYHRFIAAELLKWETVAKSTGVKLD